METGPGNDSGIEVVLFLQTGHLSSTGYKVSVSPLLRNRNLTGDFSFADMGKE